jgi:hypothetical protein
LGQTQTDLREMALAAMHPRSRERFLALYAIAQGACATHFLLDERDPDAHFHTRPAIDARPERHAGQ